MRTRRILLVTALATTLPAIAHGQCCGDCNGDGRVTVSELVSAVGTALDACPDSGIGVLLDAVEIEHATARLARPLRAGRLAFRFSADGETDAQLVALHQPAPSVGAIQVVKNGGFVRFVASEASGVETDAAVHLDPQSTMHTVTVTWSPLQSILYADGEILGSFPSGVILEFPAGSTLEVGAADGSVQIGDLHLSGSGS